jgi:hypothetical protein
LKNIQGMRRGCNMIFAEAWVLYLDHITATYMYSVFFRFKKRKKSDITNVARTGSFSS